MQIMNEEARHVVGGVDAHADTHHAAALDGRGALLGAAERTVRAAHVRPGLSGSPGQSERRRSGQASAGKVIASAPSTGTNLQKGRKPQVWRRHGDHDGNADRAARQGPWRRQCSRIAGAMLHGLIGYLGRS